MFIISLIVLTGITAGLLAASGNVAQAALAICSCLVFLHAICFAIWLHGGEPADMKAATVMFAASVILSFIVGVGSRALYNIYRQNQAVYAHVNAYVFMNPYWQSQLDPSWFGKQRARIQADTKHLGEMQQKSYPYIMEAAHMYNMRIDRYNRAVAASMVGVQYAEPVKQLLLDRLDVRVAPCSVKGTYID